MSNNQDRAGDDVAGGGLPSTTVAGLSPPQIPAQAPPTQPNQQAPPTQPNQQPQPTQQAAPKSGNPYVSAAPQTPQMGPGASYASQQQGSPSGLYRAPQAPSMPSATGSYPIQQAPMQQIPMQQVPIPGAGLPSATGQFPIMRMPNPGASGTYPMQQMNMGLPSATGTFRVQQDPTQTGRFLPPQGGQPTYQQPYAQQQYAPQQAAPQPAAQPAPPPEPKPEPKPSPPQFDPAYIADRIEVEAPPVPWFRVTLLVALVAGALSVGGTIGTQLYFGGSCRMKQPALLISKIGNQTKMGEDWQCWSDGRWKQKGKWHKGRRVGMWTSWYVNGYMQSQGNYIEGQKTGQHNTWHANGLRASQRGWERGTRDGKHQTWYKSGSPKTASTWRRGLAADTHRLWYPNGAQKSLTTYRSGKQHGKAARWHKNGKMRASGAFENDRPCGVWHHWDNDGKLQQRTRNVLCGATGRGTTLPGGEAVPDTLTGRWRSSLLGKYLQITGKFKNDSSDAFRSVGWRKELIVHFYNGTKTRRSDPLKINAENIINKPISPNGTGKLTWSGEGDGPLQVTKSEVPTVQKVTLRVWVHIVTDAGVRISYVFFQASLPAPSNTKPFDLLKQAAAKIDASTPSQPAPRRRAAAPTKSSAPPPPPPPP